MLNIIKGFKQYNVNLKKSQNTIDNYMIELNTFLKDFNINSIEDLEQLQEKDFINNCSIILGKEPNITKCCAGSDEPYFKEKEIPVIIMNPKGKNWHSPNEYVEIDSLYTLYEIFKTML